MNKLHLELINKINNLSLDVYKIYNQVVRTPINWKLERKRLLENNKSRTLWKYDVPSNLEKSLEQLKHLNKQLQTKKVSFNHSIYSKFLLDVVNATIKTAVIKIQILQQLKSKNFKSTIKLREDFFNLNYDYSNVEKRYKNLFSNPKIGKIGKELGRQELLPSEATKIIQTSMQNIKKKIDKVILFPNKFKKDILHEFTAKVEIIDDPSFSMRCITDPKTLATKILLNKNRKYSKSLLKIAFLHEFCGHALEMAIFDGTLIKKYKLPKIFGYAGVSSPNIFDVKAEVFADLMVEPFISKEEEKFVEYRRNVWLMCRAMADYLYHIKGKTIFDVMKIYQSVGLGDFAFDEAIMTSIFIDGYQGMYLFANEEIERLKDRVKITNNEFLTLLLFLGKIPVNKFSKFSKYWKMIDIFTRSRSFFKID